MVFVCIGYLLTIVKMATFDKSCTSRCYVIQKLRKNLFTMLLQIDRSAAYGMVFGEVAAFLIVYPTSRKFSEA